MDILKALETEFQLKEIQVKNTVELIDEGSTIPFIARYRKEVTGSLTDEVLRNLYEGDCTSLIYKFYSIFHLYFF